MFSESEPLPQLIGSDSTFTVGDTVRLKSGGPVMVVELIKEKTIESIKGNLVTCSYFNRDDIRYTVSFPEACLKETEVKVSWK